MTLSRNSFHRKMQEAGEGGGGGTPGEGAGADPLRVNNPGGEPGEGDPTPGEPGSDPANNVGEGGTPDWRQNLPENLRNDSRLSGYTLQQLAEAAIENPPQKPNVPKDPSEYKLPEGTPENFKTVAHEIGLDQKGLDRLVQYSQEITQANQKAVEDANVEGLNRLLDNWGDKADHNLGLARRALATFDTHDRQMTSMLKQSGSSNNPVVVQFLTNLGKMLEESPYLKDLPNSVQNQNRGQSPANVLYPESSNGG